MHAKNDRLSRMIVACMLFVPMVVALVVASAATAPASSAHAEVRLSSQPGPAARVPQRPVGLPAILPSLSTADQSSPAFTLREAAQYAAAHQMWRSSDHTLPTVVSVTFAPSRQVSAILRTSTGVPDDYLLCYVQLLGVFTFPGMNGPITYQHGFEVFDAHTGNLLIAGGRP